MNVPASRVKDNTCEEANSRTPVFYDITASPAESLSLGRLTEQKTKSNLKSARTKSRVKSSSRRTFLDERLSDEEKVDDESGGMLSTFGKKNSSGHELEGPGMVETHEKDSSLIPPITSYENSWTCPLAFDELSLSPSDPETQESSSPQLGSQSSGEANPIGRPSNRSGVILKLRRMFSEGLIRKKACYQAFSDSRTFAEGGESSSDRRTPEVTHRWQRTRSFSHALRPRSSSSKRKPGSLLKIKFCPYLSACHSAEHRRRWVLRSAVQRAQRAMRLYYPDLVGKRIRHLYEEDDKSEVWYRGEVLRVHEAHTNPLKTIFEVRYDSEPEWKYYLELLIDYKKGWLKIED